MTSSGVCKLGDFGCSVGVDSGDVPLGKHFMITIYCPPPGNIFLLFFANGTKIKSTLGPIVYFKFGRGGGSRSNTIND